MSPRQRLPRGRAAPPCPYPRRPFPAPAPPPTHLRLGDCEALELGVVEPNHVALQLGVGLRREGGGGHGGHGAGRLANHRLGLLSRAVTGAAGGCRAAMVQRSGHPARPALTTRRTPAASAAAGDASSGAPRSSTRAPCGSASSPAAAPSSSPSSPPLFFLPPPLFLPPPSPASSAGAAASAPLRARGKNVGIRPTAWVGTGPVGGHKERAPETPAYPER